MVLQSFLRLFKNGIQIKRMVIANPQGEVVEHFLTADCKSAGTPGGRLSD